MRYNAPGPRYNDGYDPEWDRDKYEQDREDNAVNEPEYLKDWDLGDLNEDYGERDEDELWALNGMTVETIR